MMRIVAVLLKVRAQPGKLRLMSDNGDWMMECPCLSKADGSRAAEEGNSLRDPTRPWGDTPPGIYGPTKVVWWPDRTPLGEAGIPLPLDTAIGPQAVAALANGRNGLWLHAGRGDSLRPAFGCLRVKFRDFVALLALIDDQPVIVEIIET